MGVIFILGHICYMLDAVFKPGGLSSLKEPNNITLTGQLLTYWRLQTDMMIFSV